MNQQILVESQELVNEDRHHHPQARPRNQIKHEMLAH